VTDHSPQNPPGNPSRTEVAIAGFRGDTATATRGLAAAGPGVRAGALTALLRCGALDASTVTLALADASTTVVRRAIEILAHAFPDDAALDARLLELLTSANDVLVEVTAWALGERHQESESALAERVAGALSQVVLDHGEPLAREAAVAALGSVGHQSGLAAVLHATADKATVRRRAVIALAAFEGPDVDAALARARSDRDWQVRQAAEDLTA
jgi:hypothetical protein